MNPHRLISLLSPLLLVCCCPKLLATDPKIGLKVDKDKWLVPAPPAPPPQIKTGFEGPENRLSSLDLPRSDVIAELTPEKIASMTDRERMALYASVMSEAPFNPWPQWLIDYFNQDERSGRMAVELLKYPLNKYARLSIWYYLARHTEYPHSAYVLKESMALFRAEGANWKPQYHDAFVHFLIGAGTETDEPLFQEIEKVLGPDATLGKIRFYRRLNLPIPVEIALPAIDAKPPGAGKSTQPVKDPASSASPPRREPPSLTSWLVIVSLAVALVGLVWIRFKRHP